MASATSGRADSAATFGDGRGRGDHELVAGPEEPDRNHPRCSVLPDVGEVSGRGGREQLLRAGRGQFVVDLLLLHGCVSSRYGAAIVAVALPGDGAGLGPGQVSPQETQTALLVDRWGLMLPEGIDGQLFGCTHFVIGGVTVDGGQTGSISPTAMSVGAVIRRASRAAST